MNRLVVSYESDDDTKREVRIALNGEDLKMQPGSTFRVDLPVYDIMDSDGEITTNSAWKLEINSRPIA